ncbi:hypothetical protein TA3x_000445 [Tundrisphaera sp. TA3]|uniref:hypothetical protein n=1 Tax=Tundrisphaera sp. TA3 TaxID=3435775 RepID=UPI003EB69C2C
MRNKHRKANNDIVTPPLLAKRSKRSILAGFGKARWIIFCEVMMAEGYTLTLYEARRTVSKYITVGRPGHAPFRVRFSDHKPISARESAGDCDFFVGVTNLATTTTGQAIAAARKHFGRSIEAPAGIYHARLESTRPIGSPGGENVLAEFSIKATKQE